MVILIFTFKSVVLPVVLVALIELAVQINLAIPALQGVSINFMSYVIISAIQLGATIDYAILYTNNFRARLRECEYKLAARSRGSGLGVFDTDKHGHTGQRLPERVPDIQRYDNP